MPTAMSLLPDLGDISRRNGCEPPIVPADIPAEIPENPIDEVTEAGTAASGGDDMGKLHL
jgi:hypothetical protein